MQYINVLDISLHDPIYEQHILKVTRKITCGM